MVNTHRDEWLIERKAKHAEELEKKAQEFKLLFGIDLIFFVDPVTGFDYVKFARVVLEPVPSGVSNNTVTAARFGVRAAELVRELIYAGSE
jgi:hypothetical protein